MRRSMRRAPLAIGIIAIAAVLFLGRAAAGDTVLVNNSGDGNAVFYIEGEPSVVINGFDLTPLGVGLPVALDAVSISVATIVPGGNIDLLVYQDGNGGSPVDATLIYREQVGIGLTGVNRIELSEPAIITEPVVWVGFNLPVGFEFYADTSGASVLTYWAWTTGGAFELSALSTAQVLGPGDGSEPVNIAMDGIARITAELRTPATEEVSAGIPLGRQILPNVVQDTSIMRAYPSCGSLLFDPEDIEITARSSFSLDCEIQHGFHSPWAVAQPQDYSLEVLRMGTLYKLSSLIPQELHVAGAVNALPEPVTHCMRVPAEDLTVAVMGEVRAAIPPAHSPENWVILPTVRFGDLICAEVTEANYVTYFVPETPESPQNVNLVIGWTEINPFPLYCGLDASINVPIVNTGQDWFDTDDGKITVVVQDFHVASGIASAERRFDIGPSQLGPGARQFFNLGPFLVDAYRNDLHRIQIIVDADNEVDEFNEADNSWIGEYFLGYAPGHQVCGPYPETMNLVWDLSNRCELSLRISHRLEADVRGRLEQLERLVVGIDHLGQFFHIEQYPPRERLEADFDNTPESDRRPTLEVYIHEQRQRYQRQVASIFATSWEQVKAQAEAAVQRRVDCLAQR